MRLTGEEREAIREVIESHDPDAKVYLFGSRVDDQKRGGDIDLLILSDKLTSQDKIELRLRLYDRIGEQKIDLLIEKEVVTPFAKMAYKQGVLL